jgi:hypothetical protein
MLTIARGGHVNNQEYISAGIETRLKLQANMPDVLVLLRQFFFLGAPLFAT